MTIEAKMRSMLEERCMFPQDAATVLESVKRETADMKGRWNDDITGYLIQMGAVLYVIVRRAALAWIDQNCPNAWYRSMFDSEQMKQLANRFPGLAVEFDKG